MNQIVNILMKKIQIIKKVKTIEIQKIKIIQKMKIVKKLKIIKIHLHSMKWKFVYDDNKEEQLN